MSKQPIAEKPAPKRNRYPKAARLGGRGTFKKITDLRIRDTRGPLTAHAVPNGLTYARLGISVRREVGTSPRRNRIKRLVREAFRLMRHDFPAGYDLVVSVRPHVPLMLADYQRLLSGFMVRLHNVWKKKTETPDPPQ